MIKIIFIVLALSLVSCKSGTSNSDSSSSVKGTAAQAQNKINAEITGDLWKLSSNWMTSNITGYENLVRGEVVDSINDIETSISIYLGENPKIGTYDLSKGYDNFYAVDLTLKAGGRLTIWENTPLGGWESEKPARGLGSLEIVKISKNDFGWINALEANFELHAENHATGEADSIHVTKGRIEFKEIE